MLTHTHTPPPPLCPVGRAPRKSAGWSRAVSPPACSFSPRDMESTGRLPLPHSSHAAHGYHLNPLSVILSLSLSLSLSLTHTHTHRCTHIHIPTLSHTQTHTHTHTLMSPVWVRIILGVKVRS